MDKNGKIAFVIQRYGAEVNGGAEELCKLLAEHMQEKYEVEILTSMSRGMQPWDNYYCRKEECINGVTIRRFGVEDASAYPKGSVEERGPFCPSLIAYLKDNGNAYKAVCFITLHYYTTCMGLKLNLNNSLFMPTAHNDKTIKQEWYKEIFTCARGFMFNSIEEKELVEGLFPVGERPHMVTCFGMDMEKYDLPDNELPSVQVEGDYILYAGRVSNSKNFRELNEFFIKYKERNPSDLKLVVLGKVDNYMMLRHHEDILCMGFVTEKEKMAYFRAAKLFVLPSKHESLSIVVLESLAQKRPVLVNGICDVLRGHCIRSNAGLYYTNYLEFEEELLYLLNHSEQALRMGENGRRYVEKNYLWEQIVENMGALIEEI